MSDIVEKLIESFQKNLNGKWIFGEKLNVGGIEIIPVSEITVEISGSIEEKEAESSYKLKFYGEPVGFLFSQNNEVRFVSIQNPPQPWQKREGEAPHPKHDVPTEKIVENLYHKINEAVQTFFTKGKQHHHPPHHDHEHHHNERH